MFLITTTKGKSTDIFPEDMELGDVGVVTWASGLAFEGEVIFRTTSGWHSLQNGTRYWAAPGYGYGNTEGKNGHVFGDVKVRLLEVGESVPLQRQK